MKFVDVIKICGNLLNLWRFTENFEALKNMLKEIVKIRQNMPDAYTL